MYSPTTIVIVSTFARPVSFEGGLVEVIMVRIVRRRRTKGAETE